MLLHFCPVGVTLSWEAAPPGSAGVPPAQILSQLRPSPPPESTGSGALPPLRPGPCGSRRQGGRLQHRTEAQRSQKDRMRAGRPRSRGCRPDGEVEGIRRATSLKAGLSPLGNSRLPASRAPAPHDWADHTRVKQVLFQVSGAPAPHDGADHSRVKQVLFQTSRAPAPHDGADHSRVKQVLFQTSRAPAPTTERITQRKNSRSSMKTNHQ